MGEGDPPEALSRLPAPGYGRRLDPAQRSESGRVLAAHYELGRSIHDLAAASGYSFGLVRSLLLEAGVTLRRRGGARRGTSTTTSTTGGEDPPGPRR